jgi:hypothetical protein
MAETPRGFGGMKQRGVSIPPGTPDPPRPSLKLTPRSNSLSEQFHPSQFASIDVLDLADESTSPALLVRLSPYSCFSQPPAALLRRKKAAMSVAGNEGNHEINFVKRIAASDRSWVWTMRSRFWRKLSRRNKRLMRP